MGWNIRDWVCLNPHPQPRIMGPIRFLHVSYVNHVLFSIKQLPRGRAGEPGGECHVLPTTPLAWVIKFLFCRVILICLKAMSIPGFPPLISHARRPWWHSTFDHAVLVSSVYVIMGFTHPIKTYATVVWGSLFPRHTVTEGLGLIPDLDQGVTSTPSLGGEHCGTLLLGSPSPRLLWFEQLVLSITFCVSRKPQPVHTEAVFSLLVIICVLGLKALHQE